MANNEPQESESSRVNSSFILSESDKKHFHDQGYLILRQVMMLEEIAPLETIYMRFAKGEIADMGRDFCDMSGPYDREYKDFSLINAMLPRVYYPLLQDNLFERLTQSIAEQLIGDSATLDYDQFLSKKPSKTDAAFPMHQDLGYWPAGTPDTKTTTCSLALDDADEENGCLMVVPGSHLEPQLRAHRPVFQSKDGGVRDGGHTLAIELTPQDKPVSLPLKAGDITVHNERIIHGSGGNISDRWRRTYVIAHRTSACVEYERNIGFTHSHNDRIQWESHLESLRGTV